MKSQYLYGASVHGIQSYIFSSNKLREIAGASEIVLNICQGLFQSNVEGYDQDQLIVGAAGKIKYIFENRESCQKMIKKFPRKVREYAPGIIFSQAVVEFTEEDSLSDVIDQLESELNAARNRKLNSIEVSCMAIARSQKTGLNGIMRKDSDVIDAVAIAKSKSSDSVEHFKVLLGENVNVKAIPHELSSITNVGGDLNANSWMAIIHADGNGLGNILQNLGRVLKNGRSNEDVKSAFRKFSLAIDNSTKNASRIAFQKLLTERTEENYYPARPVLLGGDDLTIIVRADLAVPFTVNFLEEFERQSKLELAFLSDLGVEGFENGITACAGIAFIKKNYPFYYGVDLAEQLCSDAKMFSKKVLPRNFNVPQSSFSFFKVQDSFVESLLQMRRRTLTTSEGLDYYYGPYALHENYGFPNYRDLKKDLDRLLEYSKNDGSKSIGKLRKVVSESYKSSDYAGFLLKRMKDVNSKLFNDLSLDSELKIFEIKSESNSTLLSRKSKILDLIHLQGFNYGK